VAAVQARVGALWAQADDILGIELIPYRPEAFPALEAGAQIRLHLPNGSRRDCPLRSEPGHTHRYVIDVTTDEERVAGALRIHDYLRVGMVIAVGIPDLGDAPQELTIAPFTPAVRNTPYTVELRASGKEFEVPPGMSLLQALRRHGVRPLVSCERGVCGTCITRVLEGRPAHGDVLLTSEEQARGEVMMLCVGGSHSDLLVLGL
jgi:ferredoxin